MKEIIATLTLSGAWREGKLWHRAITPVHSFLTSVRDRRFFNFTLEPLYSWVRTVAARSVTRLGGPHYLFRRYDEIYLLLKFGFQLVAVIGKCLQK
jgi:hypothetical protein